MRPKIGGSLSKRDAVGLETSSPRLSSGGDDEDDDEQVADGVHVIRSKPGDERLLSKAMLEGVYHLPISEAASQLFIGVTVLKKYCRKFQVSKRVLNSTAPASWG
jgi:hypothetical protein